MLYDFFVIFSRQYMCLGMPRCQNTKFQLCTLVGNGQIRPKMGGFHSEKMTYSGLYQLIGDKWQFSWLYQTDPISGHPWETRGPTFVFALWPNMPYFWPKVWSKMAQITVLLLYSYLLRFILGQVDFPVSRFGLYSPNHLS